MGRYGIAIAVAMLVAGCTGRPADPPSTTTANGDTDGSPVGLDPSVESVEVRRNGDLLQGLSRPDAGGGSDRRSPTQSRILFHDVASDLGVQFTYSNQVERGRRLMTEATSGTGGWFDYDGDGISDLFLGQGGDSALKTPQADLSDRLLRNEGGSFADVTANSRLPETGFTHGVAAGDFNGDGFQDLYVANVGEDALLLNLGDGTFDEVTVESGITNTLWSSGAAWADLTGDGVLDVYVCNYVKYDPSNPIACFDSAGNAGTCHPDDVDAVPNVFFAGNGDGTFRDATDELGFSADDGKSLAIAIADFTSDGRLDAYVANDVTPNHLFVAQPDGVFQEQGILRGVAADEFGHYQASMGIAFGDYDRDGLEDLYVTHFTNDSNTLYRRTATGFTDETRSTNLHRPTLPVLGFGTVMADFDGDTAADLFIANGHIDDWRETNGDAYAMRPQLFTFVGDHWKEIEDGAGSYFSGEYLGRAVATADYDRDGDLDLLVVHQNTPAAVLENRSESGHWLQLEPVAVSGTRCPIGVRVSVEAGGESFSSQLAGGTSYAATHEPILYFGLGEYEGDCRVQIEWPSGATESFEGVHVDRRLKVVEGQHELRAVNHL